jgi:hypothetical protein
MSKLQKFTLSKNKETSKWDLKKEGSTQVTKSFPNKEKATSGGVLKKALGKEGGSVRIKKENGVIQEERTFPRGKDPRSSKG